MTINGERSVLKSSDHETPIQVSSRVNLHEEQMTSSFPTWQILTNAPQTRAIDTVQDVLAIFICTTLDF